MKHITIILLALIGLSFGVKAQTHITPYHIAVGYDKTSNIIFPYAIKSVDRGSVAILAQKAKGVDNILQIKAGEQSFAETNLTVVTSDGQFYSFVVNYAEEPASLNVSFVKDSTAAAISSKPINEAEFNNIVEVIKNAPPFLHQHTYEQKMLLWLQGIYLSHNTMSFRFKLRNNSQVAYTPDFMRFFIRDRKRGKRTAVQETEVLPLYATGLRSVNGLQADTCVLSFKPFTMPVTQELVVQVGEKNGGRSLVLHISHRQLLKAKALAE